MAKSDNNSKESYPHAEEVDYASSDSIEEIEARALESQGPLQQITQPFIDVFHAPRALWGINLGYLIEGFVYFGILNYLGMYFNQYVGLGDVAAGHSITVLTAGITISMLLFGGLADRWGIRLALILAFLLMVIGRVVLAAAPAATAAGTGVWSPVHIYALSGLVLIVLGYGMYEPAAYAGVKAFTTPRTAPMGYAMLYALMNLGGFLPSALPWLRRSIGIKGVLWFFAALTLLALIVTVLLLTRRVVSDTIAKAKRAAERDRSRTGDDQPVATTRSRESSSHIPIHMRLSLAALLVLPYWLPDPLRWIVWGILAVSIASLAIVPPWRDAVRTWLANHPLSNGRFYFFISCLIPVQTLFVHNWMTMPMYVERAYRDSWPFISTNFEMAVSFNPLLVFVMVPIATALTQRTKIYKVMIMGTFIMAAPAFLLALGPTPVTLVTYLVLMTVGEAIWQPRFLQYAAEIAPEGRTGAYIGVARFPWFLTKILVPLYSGWFLSEYCPVEGDQNTERMWLVYACIAMSSTVMLVLAKRWIGNTGEASAAAA